MVQVLWQPSIIVAADCTGHGVPGGFVTMLGSLLIEKSVKNQPKNPNEILSDINRGIVTLLKQHKEDAIQDGMDIAICLVDKENKKIKFSGSRNGVHIVDLENVVSYKGDLTPVGGYFSHTNNFKERKYEIKEIQLEEVTNGSLCIPMVFTINLAVLKINPWEVTDSSKYYKRL